MAEWTTLKLEQGLRGRISIESAFLPLFLGVLLARGGMFGLQPFGIAFGAALLMRKESGALFGILGVLIGIISLGDFLGALEVMVILFVLAMTLPFLRRKKNGLLYSVILTGCVTAIVTSLSLTLTNMDTYAFLTAGLCSVCVGGGALIFWYALSHQEAIWRGEFQREQGMAWLFILIGVLSGLQGVVVMQVNFSLVLLSFFILFVSERYGAGTSAGVGAILGFMSQLSVLNQQNLMDAGIYGLAGFCTGAFRRFGKLGIGTAFLAVMLMLTFFLREEAIYSQLVSSTVGLLLFLLLPSGNPRYDFLKPRAVPEVEATVAKVKALAEIFNQIALGSQAAEEETSDLRSEVPELMNILVERVCQSCPTKDVCWNREFYKTYHIFFELFALVENQADIKLANLPIDWKRHCGRLKEMLLGVQFIIEQEKNQETWRRRFLQNQEVLSRQFLNVSQVIGNLAKELHTQHNWEVVKPSNLARRRRHLLDVGVTTFTKTGNGMSGDNYASIAFSATKHAFVLSDGMGVGENASKLSATALTLLEQLLTNGFEPEGAVQALNSILALRSPEESFVTIDMAILSLESEWIKLVKVGASTSYVVGRSGVKAYASSSLPAGILNQIEIPVIELELQNGETLVLLTDGVQDVLKEGVDWIQELLGKITIESSQEVTDLIAREARRLSGGALDDDGIILAVRKNYEEE